MFCSVTVIIAFMACVGESHVMLDDEMEEGLSPSSAIATKKKSRMTQPGEMAGEDGESVTAGEVINEKALTVVARISRYDDAWVVMCV